jgi:hypothetical protein
MPQVNKHIKILGDTGYRHTDPRGYRILDTDIQILDDSGYKYTDTGY